MLGSARSKVLEERVKTRETSSRHVDQRRAQQDAAQPEEQGSDVRVLHGAFPVTPRGRRGHAPRLLLKALSGLEGR
jgi:hypothetical protein